MRKETTFRLPIDDLTIATQQGHETTLHNIRGCEISSNIDHDINAATLTVTFVGVTQVKVDYKHHRDL